MPSAFTPEPPPRVFISYSHDSDTHRARVLALSNRLREDGIDARLDRYVRGTPPEGWPTWMANEIEDADFVLVVCTATYEQRTRKRETPGAGLGATWEGGIVTQVVYEQGRNTKFIPVVFDGNDVAHIPVFLRGATRYDVGTDAGYALLVDYLTGHHDAPMPPLGAAQRRAGGNRSGREGSGLVGAAAPTTKPVALTHTVAHPPAATPSADAFAGREPVVIRFQDGHVAAFGADRIEHARSLVLDVVALTVDGAERMQALRGGGEAFAHTSPVLALAYGAVPTVTAAWARVRDVGHEIASGVVRWRLTLEPLEATAGVMDDVTFNSVSPDDIAGWRARRILLDEHATGRRPGDPMPDGVTGLAAGARLDSTLEALLSGAMAGYGRGDGRSLGPVEGSPLPALFATWTADREAFLITARLVAALWLMLTRTVERVRRLDLAFVDPERLSVAFEGLRRRVYTNREPVEILVEGECPLTR